MSLDNCQRFECSEGYINYQSDNGFAIDSLDVVAVIVRARHDAIVNIFVVLVKTYIHIRSMDMLFTDFAFINNVNIDCAD